jgi:EF-hand domain pair
MTTINFATACVTAVLCMMAAATADAQYPAASPKQAETDVRSLRPEPGKPISDENAFKLLDENEDGAIDPAEWRRRSMAVFYVLDANADIELERDEVPGLSTELFDAADQNKDGRLSGYEFNQADFVTFEAADADGDQLVTLSEFRMYRLRLAGT